MKKAVFKKNTCFEKNEKLYKIVEIGDTITENISFIDIELEENSMIQQDFIIEFSDAIFIESNYFDQKAIEYNENKIKMNLENKSLIQDIKEKFQQFLPHRVV